MFTGIITDVGRVAGIEQRGDGRFHLETVLDLVDVAMGASIACNGVCPAVVEWSKGRFVVDVSGETLSKSTLGAWQGRGQTGQSGAIR